MEKAKKPAEKTGKTDSVTRLLKGTPVSLDDFGKMGEKTEPEELEKMEAKIKEEVLVAEVLEAIPNVLSPEVIESRYQAHLEKIKERSK